MTHTNILETVREARHARACARNFAGIGHKTLAQQWRRHADYLMRRARAMKAAA